MNKIERLIDNKVKSALKGKQQYFDDLQLAFEIFVAHYNVELDHNSEPLKNILKASGVYVKAFKEYIYKATNITKIAISDKNGLLLTFDNEFTYNNDYIDEHKWYEQAKKDDKKAITLLDDSGLLKRLTSLLTAIDKSDKLTINKVNVVKSLTTLQTQLKQAVEVNK